MSYTVQTQTTNYCSHTDAIIGSTAWFTLEYHPESLAGAEFMAAMVSRDSGGEVWARILNADGTELASAPVESVEVYTVLQDMPF